MVAEKFEAIVKLGMANTRMKDFYDLWVLAKDFEFDGAVLTEAIKATFKRRQTALPQDAPPALTAAFHDDSAKRSQWTVFLAKGNFRKSEPDFGNVAALIKRFLLPVTTSVLAGEPFANRWTESNGWV